MSCEQGLFHHHDTRTQRQKAPIVLAHLATPNDIINVVAAAAAAVSLRLGVSRRTFPPPGPLSPPCRKLPSRTPTACL